MNERQLNQVKADCSVMVSFAVDMPYFLYMSLCDLAPFFVNAPMMLCFLCACPEYGKTACFEGTQAEETVSRVFLPLCTSLGRPWSLHFCRVLTDE